MKCPKCGKELTPSKKDANYLLCYDCKKKYKVPQQKAPVEENTEAPETEETEEASQKYSNIPSKEVREERETEMRKAYDDLLAVEGKKKKKKKEKTVIEPDDDEYDDIYDEDEKMSKVPLVILGIAIVAVAALIAVMILM